MLKKRNISSIFAAHRKKDSNHNACASSHESFSGSHNKKHPSHKVTGVFFGKKSEEIKVSLFLAFAGYAFLYTNYKFVIKCKE
jgi:hypothetical protein